MLPFPQVYLQAFSSSSTVYAEAFEINAQYGTAAKNVSGKSVKTDSRCEFDFPMFT